MTDANPASKVDPETLVLRAQPRRVVRFKRHVLIGAAAVGCVALVSVAWLGLGISPPKVAAPKELFNPDKVGDTQKAKPDQLAALPDTYADLPDGVPHLGPPLPGDLGGPILEHQQASTKAFEAGSPGQPVEAVSGVFFQVLPRLAALSEPARQSTTALEALVAPLPALPAETTSQPFTDRKGLGGIYNSHSLEHPRSPYQVMAGTVIAASLLTGLKSDLPGFVIAQVTQPVFDTVTGRILLIPQGTRILGQYDDQIAFGQSRALVVWKRLILPDGTSLEIDNLPATDTRGYAGLADRVDYHSRRLLSGVGLSTLLGVAAQDGGNNEDGDLIRAFRDATQSTANQAGQAIVEKNLAIQPTITVRPGWPVRVIVHKDLVLKPYGGVTNG
jgi:type IV secretion system protein TrbI